MFKNIRMTNLINNITKNNASDITIPIDTLLILLNPNIKNINECLIIDNYNEVDVKSIDFDKILEIHGDRTGYEASCNEVRINDYIDGKITDIRSVLLLGINILELWAINLKRDYPNCSFCLIITCEENSVTLRFHKERISEERWLLEDLEQYEEAVAYRIIE